MFYMLNALENFNKNIDLTYVLMTRHEFPDTDNEFNMNCVEVLLLHVAAIKSQSCDQKRFPSAVFNVGLLNSILQRTARSKSIRIYQNIVHLWRLISDAKIKPSELAVLSPYQILIGFIQ